MMGLRLRLRVGWELCWYCLGVNQEESEEAEVGSARQSMLLVLHRKRNSASKRGLNGMMEVIPE